MQIKMIGIDHSKSPLQYREKVAFSTVRNIEFLNILKQEENILGGVVLSTCNRTEIWISYKDKLENEIDSILCKFKNINLYEYKKYFTYREDKEAIEHLFMVSSGLKSKILGEDQIITQVKNAVEISRESDFLNTTLDVLFRNAITASKKIKTQIKFKKGSFSVVDSVIKKLEKLNINVKDKSCLIIGNGEMGRLASEIFIKNGANVTMTLRQHHKGDVVIPVGVNIINFSDRVEVLPKFDIVISTTSTNRYMLKYEDVVKVKLKEKVVFIDLAVPRDIDEKIFSIKGTIGFNIDDFQIEENEINSFNETIERTKEILNEYIDNFYKWYYNKDLITNIFEISQKVADDTILRINKLVDDNTKNIVEKSSKKSIEKLIFCLRDNMKPRDFKNFMNILEKNYLNEDI
ncbi:glutamyl-tRNA reductase [uncultured Tyzzerella sp.]|uniref:glutamyl-tRNA reductase n=1 Tax=uncultured Tyzzerella sp. TaxID=2321398 RepID=UPI0029422876|nr:glutamyl-tRNA reductase [uncultured Tyzzerella sp.]